VGKATEEFQRYLRSFIPGMEERTLSDLRGKIDHSTAGAHCLICQTPGGENESTAAAIVVSVLALCIASHHSGLIDCLKPDGQDELKRRLEFTEARKQRMALAWSNLGLAVRNRAQILMCDPGLREEFFSAATRLKTAWGDRDVQFGLLVRFLFSCLIDADRSDTADFANPAAAQLRQNQSYASWDTLLSRLHKHIEKMDTSGAVNRLRQEISDGCFQASERSPGIYTLTVPTGGGKTLSALRYALEHARIHDLKRVICVSPYISIVDQNAAVARACLEPSDAPYGSVVLEHHSNLGNDTELDSPNSAQWRRRLLAENWDAPVVFTTSAQVLEALFGKGTRAVRRLHALTRAVLVFDEAQTIPVSMIHLFNNAVNLLVSHCQSSVLLCTATQPLLEKVNAEKGAALLGKPAELIKDTGALFRQFKRYDVLDHTEQAGGWTHGQVAELISGEARNYGSCLAIVNTKRDARELFRLLIAPAPNVRVSHLSTGMCPAHRLAVLDEIKALLAQEHRERPLICISTQLIEAGVDIDFASVVRDLAGLDSLMQAAGRCNRHGHRQQGGRVHIVDLPEPPRQLDDICKGRAVARELLGTWRRQHPNEAFPLDDPNQMKNYYELSFFRRRDEMAYNISAKTPKVGRDTTLIELLGKNSSACNDAKRNGVDLRRSILLQSFQTAASLFELIAPTQGIIVPYGTEGEQIVNKLASSFDLDLEWKLLRRAQQFTISVHEQQFQNLLKTGAVYEVNEGSGVFCLQPQFYENHYGLRTEAGLMEDLYV